MRFLFLSILLIPFCNLQGQITPPGMGETNTASWVAVGTLHHLDKSEKISLLNYLGLGSISEMSSMNPFHRVAIYVVSNELKYKFNKNWNAAIGTNYHWQNIAVKSDAYSSDGLTGKQEIRIFTKLSYVYNKQAIKCTVTVRPEYRSFYNPDFSSYTEVNQFRLRLKGASSIPLNAQKTQKLIVGVEFLGASSKHLNWEAFQFKDCRMSIYYSLTFPESNIKLDIGYMNDLSSKGNIKDASYLGLNLLFLDLFKRNEKAQ